MKDKAVWIQIFLISLAVLLLEGLARLHMVSATVLTPPSIMVQTLWHLIVNGEVAPHFKRTMIETAISFGVAVLLGIPLGILLSKVSTLRRISEPYLAALYAVPLVFFYPLLLALFGLGPTPIIIVSAVMGTIPIIINTRVGFGNILEIYHKVGRATGCNRRQLYSKIFFPAAAPLLFAGLKLGFLYALIGCVAQEFIMADKGMGFMVSYYYQLFETEAMYAYILLNLLIAILVNTALLRSEKSIKGLR